MADHPSVWADIRYFCIQKGVCANAPPKHRSRFGHILSMVPIFYKSPKFIKVDEPAVVIGCRSLQLTALVVSLLPLYFGDAWALAESAGGTVNAWAEAGGLLTAGTMTRGSAFRGRTHEATVAHLPCRLLLTPRA